MQKLNSRKGHQSRNPQDKTMLSNKSKEVKREIRKLRKVPLIRIILI